MKLLVCVLVFCAPALASPFALLPPTNPSTEIKPKTCAGDLARRAFVELAESRRRERERTSQRLARTFEELARPTPKPKSPVIYARSACFTARMRVLTPHGLVPISDLRERDWVMSYDFATRAYVPSRIARIKVSSDQPYGVLTDHAVPVEVTARHRFYVPRRGFEPIAELTPETRLWRWQRPAQPTAVPRGNYVEYGQIGTVYELSLEPGPHNFFVEGLLVHNIKVSG